MAEQPMTDRERAKRLATDLARILAALDERLQRSVEPFAADSAILHFSLAFEVSWKLCQSIAEGEAVRADSPASAFRAAFKLGFISDEEELLRLVRTRNQIIHIYRAEFAAAVLAELPAHFITLRTLLAASLRQLDV